MGKGQSNSFGRSAMGNGQFKSFDSSKPFENTSSVFGVYPVRGSEYKPNINAQVGNRRKSHYVLSQPGFDNYYGWKIQWNMKPDILLDY